MKKNTLWFLAVIAVFVLVIGGSYLWYYGLLPGQKHLSPLIFKNYPPGGAPVVSPAEAAQLSDIQNGDYTLYVLNSTSNETPQEFIHPYYQVSLNTTYPNFTKYINALWFLGYYQVNTTPGAYYQNGRISEEVMSTNDPSYVYGFFANYSMGRYVLQRGSFGGLNYVYTTGQHNYTNGNNDISWFAGYDDNTVVSLTIDKGNIGGQTIAALVANDILNYNAAH